MELKDWLILSLSVSCGLFALALRFAWKLIRLLQGRIELLEGARSEWVSLAVQSTIGRARDLARRPQEAP